jgi:hypothetical protein
MRAMMAEKTETAIGRAFRKGAIGIGSAELVFWAYTFWYTYRHSNPHGDGMEWVAIMPLGVIAFGLAWPGLALALAERTLLAVALVSAAAVADALLWWQIVRDFTHG